VLRGGPGDLLTPAARSVSGGRLAGGERDGGFVAGILEESPALERRLDVALPFVVDELSEDQVEHRDANLVSAINDRISDA
jgi:hypothetical protein